jgi:hypothetical protein
MYFQRLMKSMIRQSEVKLAVVKRILKMKELTSAILLEKTRMKISSQEPANLY